MNESRQDVSELQPVNMNNVAVRSLRDNRTIVAEGVTWRIQAGDYWVVAGLQGSGKTDLLLTIAGLTPPARGEYELFGEKMPIFEEHRMPTRLRLGLVFEGGQLFNHLSIADNISLPLRYHRNLSHAEVEADLKQLLDMLDLGAFAASTPGALGRNWQRRAGLARALALKPEILLLDSPLAGLDLPHASWWLRFLGSLSAGHPWLEGRPMTLVVTAADLLPWRGRARQFAALREKRLSILGSWDRVQAEGGELIREMLDDKFFGGERI